MLLLQETNPLDFYYDGKEQLKGVLRNTPYPVIWIDMQDPHFQDHEQNLLNKQPARDYELRKFCEEFVQQTGRPLMRPFIEGDETFFEKPPNYDQELEETKKHYSNYYADDSYIKEPEEVDKEKQISSGKTTEVSIILGKIEESTKNKDADFESKGE